jgi:hypothetical protein
VNLDAAKRTRVGSVTLIRLQEFWSLSSPMNGMESFGIVRGSYVTRQSTALGMEKQTLHLCNTAGLVRTRSLDSTLWMLLIVGKH